ncbi:MAG: hypothetical protein Ct9H300mP23_08600 [Nitrospinota bacterium]|nr:MAG: hypothetical protein Ct9H300mP23_08600 [Nitrospinota bacterium]
MTGMGSTLPSAIVEMETIKQNIPPDIEHLQRKIATPKTIIFLKKIPQNLIFLPNGI